MSYFSSRRERRLWACTLAVVAAIYATLALASSLAEVLYDQQRAAVVFLAGMFLLGLTILTQGMKTRPGGIEIGVGLGIAVVYMMVLARLTFPERSHLIEYGVVAVFIYEALTERASQGRRVPLPALLAILTTTAIGAIDEATQAVLPSRVFEWTDMVFNFLAALMAVAGMVVLGWARRLTNRTRRRNE